MAFGPKPKNLTGQRFKRWTVIRRSKRKYYWVCHCDCGTVKSVAQAELIRGYSGSCGCLQRELIRGNTYNRTHGEGEGTTEYWAWKNMKKRCYKQSSQDYPRYGGRGIKVCKRWFKYENFLADMGRRPSPNHSLDRIDNDGDYKPSNCRWATAREQRMNQNRMKPK